MSLETRVIALAEAVGTDIKSLTVKQGDLTSLSTTAKGNLVAALNELKGAIDTLSGASGAVIDDASTATDKTWSASKIGGQIDAAVSALVASSPAALDTLNELAAALGNDPNFAATLASEIGNRVRYDAEQVLTAPQKAQACANIGAVSAAAIGDPETDLVALYVAAKS